MSDPETYDEYVKLSHANQVIGGTGLETYMEPACPFCAAPGFTRWKVLDMENTANQPVTCKNCGRTAQLIFDRLNGGIGFEVVQTGGDDPPSYLPPMRRAP